MAWIQAHQELRTHRKVLAAAEALHISVPQMIGHLVLFWCWAIDNAPSGSLEGITNKLIAEAAIWSTRSTLPDRFVDALITVGLLDRDERSHIMYIHDWEEYTGRLIERRAAEKNRSRRRRAADTARTTTGQPQVDPPHDHQPTVGKEDEIIPQHTIPSLSEVTNFCQREGLSIDAGKFVNYYEARGWQIDGRSIANWQATVRTWARRERGTPASSPEQMVSTAPDAAELERMQQLRERLCNGSAPEEVSR